MCKKKNSYQFLLQCLKASGQRGGGEGAYNYSILSVITTRYKDV